jgi:hypothetical protein
VDNAVSVVETYLRVNGYFTVTEFPVVELPEGADYRTATDLDVLAVRFPSARRVVPGESRHPHHAAFEPDPALGAPSEQVDMIVGEVKEASAEFNRAGLRPEVLEAALARFGCCPESAKGKMARTLIARGRAKTHLGHDIRLIAFGGRVGEPGPYLQVSLAHVVGFLSDYVRAHWEVLKHTQSKDPVLGFLMLMEKLQSG